MGILSWIVLGLLAGVIAKVIMPGRDPGGLILTIVLGIVGALLGGYIGTHFGYGSVTYDASIAMAELSLLPAIRRVPDDAIIVADGTSCRHQIYDGTGRRAVHVACVLAMRHGRAPSHAAAHTPNTSDPAESLPAATKAAHRAPAA